MEGLFSVKFTPLLVFILFLVVSGSAACDEKLPLPAEPVMDYYKLMDNLRVAGVRALPGEAVDQPFFSVQGRMIEIGGEDVQVFQYPHAAAASEQAALVSPDGGAAGTSMIHWIGQSHFFRKDSLLVLYVGDDEKVIKALEAVLGRQFAGK